MAKVIRTEVVATYTVELDNNDLHFLGEIAKALSEANRIEHAVELRKFIAGINGKTLRGPLKGTKRGPYKPRQNK